MSEFIEDLFADDVMKVLTDVVDADSPRLEKVAGRFSGIDSRRDMNLDRLHGEFPSDLFQVRLIR